jgi:hypothetical protein
MKAVAGRLLRQDLAAPQLGGSKRKIKAKPHVLFIFKSQQANFLKNQG